MTWCLPKQKRRGSVFYTRAFLAKVEPVFRFGNALGREIDFNGEKNDVLLKYIQPN